MTIQRENNFWLSIMRDHAYFIRDSLASKEADTISVAQEYIDRFEELLERSITFGEEIILEEVRDFYQFKRSLLAARINNEVALDLPPTFISHMMNELQEYIDILVHYIDHGEVPIFPQYRHHYLWLLDAAGHLETILAHLDPVEKLIAKKVKTEKKHIKKVWLKALEFIGYLRATQDIPALDTLDREAIIETAAYLDLLAEIAHLFANDQIQSTLTSRMLDHMQREQEYYLSKVKSSALWSREATTRGFGTSRLAGDDVTLLDVDGLVFDDEPETQEEYTSSLEEALFESEDGLTPVEMLESLRIQRLSRENGRVDTTDSIDRLLLELEMEDAANGTVRSSALLDDLDDLIDGSRVSADSPYLERGWARRMFEESITTPRRSTQGTIRPQGRFTNGTYTEGPWETRYTRTA